MYLQLLLFLIIFDLFKSQLGIDDLAVAIQFYNEKIIIKMNQLYGIIDNNPKKFVSLLIKSASTLMINSLFSNNMAYISNVNANYIAGILRQSGFEESANYIYSDLTDENNKLKQTLAHIVDMVKKHEE